jgi:deoxyadenosine/deoxycytidine kinase
MGRLIYVEGIIGAGKSTYAREVGERLNYRVFKEPVDKTHLDRFYADPKKYAFNYQVFILHKRIGIQNLAAAESLYSDRWDGAIVDRSLFGDAAFAELHAEEGNIEPLDLEAYQQAKHNMQLMIWPPTTLVFLDVQPGTAMDRIKVRMAEEAGGRDFELGIDVEYLEKLRKAYKKLIKSAKDGKYPWSHNVDVIHVEWNPATRTSGEWDAVAAGLKEDWS